jgi:AAA family ATP:ADP antiporter
LADGRIERFFRRHGDVRGREYRASLALFGFFFLITAAFYIIKPVKESLLIGARPSWWPYADLATALLIGFVVALNARLLDRLPRRTYLTASILFFIASLGAFWYIFDVHWRGQIQTPVADSSGVLFLLWAQTVIESRFPVFVIAFCFWADVFIAMSVTQYWIAVNDVFNPHQAKRLVGLFVMGGLLGGIAGSLVAALTTFAKVIRPENLLLICPFLLVLALVTVNVVYSGRLKIDAAAGDSRIAPASRVGYLESFRTVRKNGYLLLLASMLFAAIAAGTLVNYQFKTVVARLMPDKDIRTAFIAGFFLVVLVVSTLFHAATSGRFLKSYGIRWAISLAPALLLLGSASVFAIPAGLLLAWVLAVRGGDKLFDNTLSQSVRELLYIPVSADIKYKAKVFIDMFVNKFATGLGAGIFLVLQAVRHFDSRGDDQTLAIVREIGVPALAFLVLWLVLTRLVYRRYPDVLKPEIRRRWVGGETAIAAHVDVDMTMKVFNTIQSRERSTTIYLMNLFDLVSHNELTPDLKELLGIKRDEIMAQGMDALLDVGGTGFFPGIEEAVDDPDIRREIDLVFLLPAYQEIMAKRLGEIIASASEVDRIEAAKIIGRMVPNGPTLEALERLLRDPSAEVVLYALESAAVHRRPEHVPAILAQLANPMTRAEARTALSAFGPGIEDTLSPALRDESLSPDIARAVPEILARIGTQRAADILVGELARHREGIETAVVDALFRIRCERPEVRFRKKDVKPEVLRLMRKCCDLVLAPPGSAEGVAAALSLRVKRAFDLLTLLHPPDDIVMAYQNILQGTPRSVDYALEHLDTMLDRELKALLFPLVEDLPAADRAARLRRALRLK